MLSNDWKIPLNVAIGLTRAGPFGSIVFTRYL